MAGVIKKLYHPTDNGTVTTAVSPELQEVYPITATSGVYAPEGAFHANDNLDQILRWLDTNKISGSGLKTLTVNGTENSLIGSGTIVINTGGGGGGGDSDFFELDASGNLHVKNDRGLWTGSFISAGGVGSGGGGGGGDTAYRAIAIKGYGYDYLNPDSGLITNICTDTNSNPFYLQEGNGITLSREPNDVSNTIIISATGGTGSLPRAGSGLQYGTGANADVLSLKLGSGLGIDGNGAVYNTGGSYSLPVASASQLGGVKVGNSLTISNQVLDINETNLRNGWMDLTTNQVVATGALKTFVDGIEVGPQGGGHTIYYDTINRETVITGPVRIDGNLYATGSITAGA